MVCACEYFCYHMDVDDYMALKNKLMKPRDKLIKALCREKYGQRNWNANEMMEVIHENDISLYKDGKDRTDKQIQNAMSIAYEKLNQ